ncbi:MAG: hypothetical protein CVT63_02095, partial [Candidatus Anoxymicrobium japonicum]
MEAGCGNRRSNVFTRVVTTIALVLLLAGLAPGLFTGTPVALAIPKSTPDQNTCVTNGTVLAVAATPTTIYIGGEFTTVGPQGGAMQGRNRIAALDATTGALTGWNPGADGKVCTLLVSGTTVYAGGEFHNIGGQVRNHIAAFDTTTGAILGWNPNSDDTVTSLLASGGIVYVGGYFSNIGGQARTHLAAIDSGSGLATGWSPNITSGALWWDVGALALSGDANTLYIGGNFSKVGGQTRNHIAAVNTATGAPTTWNPGANDVVRVLLMSGTGTTIYAGGYFHSIDGAVRNHIAELDTTTGSATTWDPNADNTVFALALSGSTVYAGGDFATIGTGTRNRFAALSTTTGLATSWNPNGNQGVASLVLSGSRVYSGGWFTTVGGANRNYFARFDNPIIASVSPTSGAQGQTMNADIVGTDTAFGAGSTASFGADIIVNSTTVTDATHATANITIDAGA